MSWVWIWCHLHDNLAVFLVDLFIQLVFQDFLAKNFEWDKILTYSVNVNKYEFKTKELCDTLFIK